jgi:maltose alpha-D-glucosyltransferase / alpha-amylase
VDAVPYLYRAGGHDAARTCPRRTRPEVPARAAWTSFTPELLLAEANQWPEDVRHYFGDGDEFHMAFHFPLMPRMFMALRLEDRKPLVEIVERTPPIPDTCQWGIFLRNHDELTLEMVTDEERDYMYASTRATRGAHQPRHPPPPGPAPRGRPPRASS